MMFLVCGSLTVQSVGNVYGQELEGAVEADAPTPLTQAEKDEQARQAYLRGRELFDAKSFDESAEEFRKAYELSGRPILLLSIASAHERAGRFDLALRTLRDYRPFATDEDVGEVDFRIQSIEGRIQALEQAKSPPEDDKPLVLKKTAPPAEKTSLATVGWVLTGVGVASAITGGVFYALGEQKHRDVADAKTRSEAVALISSGDSKKNTGYIFMGAGAAAIIGGVTLVLVSSDDEEAQVALSVSPSSEGAVLALTGGF